MDEDGNAIQVKQGSLADFEKQLIDMRMHGYELHSWHVVDSFSKWIAAVYYKR